MKKLSGPQWVTSREKRLFDIACAAPAAVASAPVTLLAAAALAITTHESPLFRQERPGLNGSPFTMLKLRTMPTGTPDTRSDGHNDARATGEFARVLRQLRVDETLQLGNVLAGDMSMVGPRPLVQEHIQQTLTQLPPRMRTPWLDARRMCRPGLVDPYLVDVYTRGVESDPEEWAESDIRYAAEGTFADDREALVAWGGFYKHLATEKLSAEGVGADEMQALGTLAGLAIQKLVLQ